MPSEIFCCYAREDQVFLQELQEHLSELQRQGLITLWSDTDISPGTDWQEEINKHLNAAHIFLLLISSKFMASDYCNGTEIKRAMERQQAGEAHVIPIILRPTHWEGAPFSHLQALPQGAKPISSWSDRDEAFLEIVSEIRKVIEGSDSSLDASTPHPLNMPRRYVVVALSGIGVLGLFAGSIYLFLSRNVPGIQTPSIQTPTATISTNSTLNGRILYRTASSGSFSVNFVQWSPDGHYLVTADGDKTASVLDATSGTRLTTYRKHNNYVNAVAWSPDGKEIASASADDTVQIWNAQSENTRLKYQAPIFVWSVAWSPNGKHIASAGHDSITQIWDASTGQPVTAHQGPADGIYAIAWSHDNKRIATGYADGTVQVWDAIDGHLLRTYHGQSGYIYEVMWSHNDDAIVSASKDYTVHIWNSTDGTPHRIYTGHSAPVHAAEWSPNGTLIASSDEFGSVKIWNVTTGKTIYDYHGHTKTVASLTWSPDGKHIASGSDDGTIRVWDVK